MTPRRSRGFAACVFALSAIACPLSSKTIEPPLPAVFDGNKTIRGTVRDSLTGAPVPMASVEAQGRDPYRDDAVLVGPEGSRYLSAYTDTAGGYAFRRLDPGTWTIVFRCPRVSTLYPRSFATHVVPVFTRMLAVVDVLVPPDACREPAYFERRGVYRGHYTEGFEHRYFHPCPDSTPGLPEGFMAQGPPWGPNAWATPTSKAMWLAAEFPPRLASDGYYTTYFVRW